MIALKSNPPKKSRKTSSNIPTAPFLVHLSELKYRLSVVLLSIMAGSLLGYILNEDILNILLAPIDQPLYYSSPSGGFSFVFSTSVFFGFLFTIPIFIYQILSFIAPIIPTKNRSSTLILLFFSLLLLFLGVLFAYYISLPAALHFLSTFSGSSVKSLISTSEYFTFVSRYLLGFGVLFQLPLIIIFINQIKKIQLKQLLLFERWVILFSFIISAILTPTPDIINQFIMGIPIILLYQISVIMVYLININTL